LLLLTTCLLEDWTESDLRRRRRRLGFPLHTHTHTHTSQDISFWCQDRSQTSGVPRMWRWWRLQLPLVRAKTNKNNFKCHVKPSGVTRTQNKKHSCCREAAWCFVYTVSYMVWYRKTRMLWLPDGEKRLRICLLVSTQCTNMTDRQTDGQTPHGGIGLAYAGIAR